MTNEKRLIDANDALERLKKAEREMKVVSLAGCKAVPMYGVIDFIETRPTVDAVEVEKYIELREQYDKIFTAYHELRDAFIDYVCSGVPNPSPICLNKCPGCCDAYGWCKNNDKCQGFNPAEVILDEERRTDERTD